MAKKIRIQAELDDSKLRKQLDDIGKRKEKITVDVDSGNIGNADQSMKHLNRTVSDSNRVFGRLKSTISNTFSSGKIALTGYLSGNVKGSKNLGVGNYTPTQTTKVKQKVEIEPVFDGNKANRAAKSAGSKAGKSYKDGLKEELSNLDSVISGITGKIDDQISAINEQKSAALDAISEEKEALEEAKDQALEAIEQERQARLDAIEEQRKQIEQNISEKQKIIDSINDEIKAMRSANSYRKLQNTLMKEQYELERLQHQHTILQYNEDKGIHYVANTKNMHSQKQAVEDAKLEIEIANKEKQIDLIEKEISLLENKLQTVDKALPTILKLEVLF